MLRTAFSACTARWPGPRVHLRETVRRRERPNALVATRPKPFAPDVGRTLMISPQVSIVRPYA
ncbi:hypothetical protein GCM10022233_61790 [Streptomyces shaanxiensis]|uniref:Uncharacterized protein n=1 Tax=Streptomyces shaanxiensis TaxID=653357 RepID=A0ABP7VV41_9ACTN